MSALPVLESLEWYARIRELGMVCPYWRAWSGMPVLESLEWFVYIRELGVVCPY